MMMRRLICTIAFLAATQAALATTPPLAAPPSALPVLLPDGRPYTDADISARGLPEASPFHQNGYPGAGASSVPQISPMRRLTDDGWLAATTNRPAAASLQFGRALRINPNDRRLLWVYGWSMINLGDPACALEAFQRNLSFRPQQRPQWVPMAMALTYTAAGQRDVAVAWYRTASTSDPLRFGTHDATLRTTLHWTSRERALIRQLIAYAQDDSALAAR